jgi:hypothetical protein
MMSGVPFVPHFRRTLLRGFHFAEPGLSGGGQRIAPLEHRKRGGVAHDRRPDAEQTVGLGLRGSDIAGDLGTADQTPGFPGCEVGVADPKVNSLPFGSSTLRARISGGRASTASPRSSHDRRRESGSRLRRDSAEC